MSNEFSVGQAARLSGLTIRQLQRWDNLSFISPSAIQVVSSVAAPRRRNPNRLYTFSDVVTLRMISAMLGGGAKLLALRRAAEQLRTIGNAINGSYIVWDGVDVLWCTNGQLISLINKPGQSTMTIVNVDMVANEVREILKQKQVA